MNRRDNSDLQLLLATVDKWFSDKAFRVPLEVPAECTYTEDQEKLAQINRATSRWFGSLTNTLTSEGISDDDDDCETDDSDEPLENGYEDCLISASACKPATNNQVIVRAKAQTRQRNISKSKPRPARKKKQNIDELARNLERMLEQDDESPAQPAGPTLEYFNTYCDNELALLDETIGAVCTLIHSNNSHKAKDNEKLNQASKWSSLTDNSKSIVDNDHIGPLRTRRKTRVNIQSHLPTSKQQTSRVRTPCPPTSDHDYLPRAPIKSLVLSNKLLQCARQTQVPVPVLNVAALKRFARFSTQFRSISMEHDSRILAICNE